MFGLQNWALALTAALSVVQQTAARPTEVHPGSAKDIVVTAQDTLNGTVGGVFNTPNAGSSSAGFKITITNNIASGLKCYVTGQDPAKNNSPAMLQNDGTWYYPTSSGPVGVPQPITADIGIPMNDVGQTTDLQIPGYLISARVWFAVGDLQFFAINNGDGTYSVAQPSETNTADPSAGINWGFVEFNYDAGTLFANISYVDFVGLPLGMSLTNSTGGVQSALGLPSTAVTSICGDLKTQAGKDGRPWDKLCQSINGTTLRVLSPYAYMMAPGNTGFEDYFSDYVDQVWEQFSSQSLTILPQNGNPDVTCSVSGDILGCDGDNKNYTKPSSADIFGCNTGPLTVAGDDTAVHRATVPRLCAAFHRATFLLDGGDVQPSLGEKYYYTADVGNFYSQIVHKYEVDGKGYAFSYDDINPAGPENASGSVASDNPVLMTVTVGGPTQ